MKKPLGASCSLIALVVLGTLCATLVAKAPAQTAHSDEFVKRAGTTLSLAGENYRYSGPNVEWLGIEAYGPDDALGPRYPSHLEVDDALDTAKMMGARVVRSQTMGDSVGCDLCLEPHAGVYNPRPSRQSITPSKPHTTAASASSSLSSVTAPTAKQGAWASISPGMANRTQSSSSSTRMSSRPSKDTSEPC